MKKLIITLSSLGFLLLSAQGQMGGPGSGPMDPSTDPQMGPGGPNMPDNVAAGLPEEIQALRDELQILRESLMAERQAVIDALGEDASREEIIAAVVQWENANSDVLAEMRAQAEALREEVMANRPGFDRNPIPEDIIAQREDLNEQRRALAESRRDAILALGEDPTDEEVQDAIDQWRADNAEAIADVEVLAAELRDWFRSNRPGRVNAPDSPRMSQRAAAFRENAQAIRQNRQQLRNQLQNPDLTPEARRELMQQFRQEQRTILQERQELKRQERIDQAGAGGDRRPGG
mgnify:CR=1 FL=1|jgi:hypothetical protein